MGEGAGAGRSGWGGRGESIENGTMGVGSDCLDKDRLRGGEMGSIGGSCGEWRTCLTFGCSGPVEERVRR